MPLYFPSFRCLPEGAVSSYTAEIVDSDGVVIDTTNDLTDYSLPLNGTMPGEYTVRLTSKILASDGSECITGDPEIIYSTVLQEKYKNVVLDGDGNPICPLENFPYPVNICGTETTVTSIPDLLAQFTTSSDSIQNYLNANCELVTWEWVTGGTLCDITVLPPIIDLGESVFTDSTGNGDYLTPIVSITDGAGNPLTTSDTVFIQAKNGSTGAVIYEATVNYGDDLAAASPTVDACNLQSYINTGSLIVTGGQIELPRAQWSTAEGKDGATIGNDIFDIVWCATPTDTSINTTGNTDDSTMWTLCMGTGDNHSSSTSEADLPNLNVYTIGGLGNTINVTATDVGNDTIGPQGAVLTITESREVCDLVGDKVFVIYPANNVPFELFEYTDTIGTTTVPTPSNYTGALTMLIDNINNNTPYPMTGGQSFAEEVCACGLTGTRGFYYTELFPSSEDRLTGFKIRLVSDPAKILCFSVEYPQCLKK